MMKNNIMNCLLAQKMGAAFTATQIARTDFVPVVEQLYLVNRVVSPHISTTHNIRIGFDQSVLEQQHFCTIYLESC